jgi:hypothetical protein
MKIYRLVYFCLVLSKTAAATSRGYPSANHVCSTARLAARPHALRPCARQPRGCHFNLKEGGGGEGERERERALGLLLCHSAWLPRVRLALYVFFSFHAHESQFNFCHDGRRSQSK